MRMTKEKVIEVFYFLILVGSATAMPRNLTLQERIPIYLQELCPGTGVCLNDVIDPEDKEPSCCGECSCSVECKASGDCCFPAVKSGPIDTECLYPHSMPQDEVSLSFVHQSYHMVSYSPDDSESDERNNRCGDARVAAWGSMLPVYSQQTGKVYKNRVCAEAYNVTDGEEWSTRLSCEAPNDLFDLPSFILRGVLPEFCHVEFLYNKSLISSEQCFKPVNSLSKCSHDIPFEIPNATTATADDIIAACTSGLESPYMHTFVNVFCFICTQHVPVSLPRCYYKLNEGDLGLLRGLNGALKFTFIFETSIFNNDLVEDYTESVNTGIACPLNSHSETSNGCRPISCPLGQILNQRKNCIYFGSKWIVNEFYVYITLSSIEVFSVSSLTRSILNLKSPWPAYWTINTISYEPINEDLQTRSLIILQHIQFNSPFDPKPFFKRFKKYMHKPWLLVSYNTTIMLQARISNFVTPTEKILYTHHIITNIDAPVVPRTRKHITNLYLCHHVTLLPTEYSIIDATGAILNKITNTILHNGEFTTKHDGNKVSPGVCLEKSGLYRIPKNNAVPTFPWDIIYLCIVTTVVTRFLQGLLVTCVADSRAAKK